MKTKTRGAEKVGRFSVDLELSNDSDLELLDRKLIKPDKVRKITISGVIDSGAVRLVLPQSVAKQLGLRVIDRAKVRYANGQTATREIVGGVYLEMQGRGSTFAAVVEPKRRDALIGAVVLEELDFLVDCTNRKIVPRDPRIQICELD